MTEARAPYRINQLLPPLGDGDIRMYTMAAGDTAWEEVKGDMNRYGLARHRYPRILAITPFHPSYGARPQTWQSIRAALRAYPGAVDWIMSDGDNPHTLPYENVTHQHNKARKMALDGGYDALLSIEADMIVPEDAIERLVACDADIAYGLYVWRSERLRYWSAYHTVGLFKATSISQDETGESARETWGRVTDVAGLGMGCTLIRRNVLEALPFRLYEGEPGDWLIEAYAHVWQEKDIDPHKPRRAMFCDDWMLALDAQHYGFTQRCDLGLVCGHIDNDVAIWPDPTAPELYREELIS